MEFQQELEMREKTRKTGIIPVVIMKEKHTFIKENIIV